MTYQDYLKFVFALIFVISLMGGLSLLLKRFGFGQGGLGAMISPKNKRLKVIEITPIDPKHKAVLLQRDDIQHLVLFGANGDTVIETNIKAPQVQPEDKNETT